MERDRRRRSVKEKGVINFIHEIGVAGGVLVVAEVGNLGLWCAQKKNGEL